MKRALAAALLLCLGACEAVGSQFFSLGNFDREFPGTLRPVAIPGFELDELLTPENVELLLDALGYDPDELRRAGADPSDLQSVVRATRALGVPLDEQDESIRFLLSHVASSYLSESLSNEDKGRLVRADLSRIFDAPFDYDRLEASIRERALRSPVEIEIVRRAETIDELFRGNLELVALVRSGWLASLKVTEIGLRTLFLEEEFRHHLGAGFSGSLHDPERMDRCVEPEQERIYGVERVEVALRSLSEGAAWIPILGADLETEHAICSFRTTMRSPELVEVLAEDQGLEVRIRVRALLPRQPFRLGGYLWFSSKSVTIDAGEF